VEAKTTAKVHLTATTLNVLSLSPAIFFADIIEKFMSALKKLLFYFVAESSHNSTSKKNCVSLKRMQI
jgi:hypothetical protein